MTKKSNDLLPIGASIMITPGAFTGRVLGYGFEQDLRNSAEMTTIPVYIIHLNEGCWLEGRAMYVSVVVANPDNVKEA